MPGTTTLSIHLGAAGLRAIATYRAERGAAVSVPVQTLTPHPGWAEQRPDDWWEALCEAAETLGREIPLTEATEVHVSASLQASIFLDGEGEVIRPAILASDTRAAAEVAKVASVLGRAPAWPVAAHLRWLRLHQAIAFKRVRAALSPKAYLRLRLTGDLACEPGDSVSTGLFDADAGRWSEAACDALEISLDVLPPVRRPQDASSLSVAAAIGLPIGVPVLD